MALGLLALAAIAVGVAGFEHARLVHRGYDAIQIVGPLFILNAIGSTAASLRAPLAVRATRSRTASPSELTATDYGEELSDAQITALAAFVAAASGSDEADDEGGGRGRGRQRSGSGRGRDGED